MSRMYRARGWGFEQHTPPASPPPVPVVYDDDRTPARWEYRVVSVDLREETPLDEERLNALGAEGWLLISVVSTGRGEETRAATYYFVRSV